MNDLIHGGPKLQNDLFDVLIRFRTNVVPVVCDISETYLQIKLKPDDCRYLQFLWRKMDQLKKPSCYEFQRLIFGLNSAPFEAQYILRRMQKKKKKTQKEFRLALETVLDSTYMDEIMDSFVNEDEAMKLVQQLKELWRKV